MSSSRRAGVRAESVRAALERDKAGVSGARGIPRTQLAWLAAAALVILLLIVVLAWLAYSNATKVRALPGADARRPPPADLMLAHNNEPAQSRQAMVMLAPTPARTVEPKPRVPTAKLPARKPKAAAPPKPEPEAEDTDVVLLSAIVAHASRHAAERAQQEAAACAGKKCPAKGPAQP